jgi:murein DD-endopeptidase MepM/ murein hydrolase activator NlpD
VPLGRLLAAAALLLAGCRGVGPVGEMLRPRTPWEEYRDSLQAARLEETAVGRAWLSAGRLAEADAPRVGMPYREVVHFDPLRPTAAAWRLSLARGQELRVQIAGLGSRQTEAGAVEAAPGVFVDLLRLDGAESESVAALEEGLELRHRVRRGGPHVLRLQPELLAGGRWTVTVGVGASLAFPVEGRTSSAIGGRYGDPRDAGARSHEGVDIFAPRGTRALAAAPGRVSRVAENRLGGKTVWLQTDDALGLYYAHLDRQLVRTGERVRAGETVGRVGNTGNAARTAPHLHFSIYDDGPVDPFPFLHEPAERPAEVTSDLASLGDWVRVSGERVNLRSGPSTATAVRGEAVRHEALRVEGASADWYRVRAVGGLVYVASRLVEGTASPVWSSRLTAPQPLLHEPETDAPVVAEAPSGTSLEVLAQRTGHLLVRRGPGERPAWVDRGALPEGATLRAPGQSGSGT